MEEREMEKKREEREIKKGNNSHLGMVRSTLLSPSDPIVWRREPCLLKTCTSLLPKSLTMISPPPPTATPQR
jgi:hypothetical protein